MAKKNDNNLIIGAIMMVVAFGVYKWRSTIIPAAIPNNEVPIAPSQKAQPTAPPQLIDKANAVSAKEQDRKRMALAAKEKLGMKSMPIPHDGRGNYELMVELAIKPLWCKAGDYDAIKGFVRDFDKKLFLLDIESSTSMGQFAKPIRVNLGEIAKGFKHVFKLNMSEKTNENITLSLCTDRAKKGNCSDYKPADYPKIDAIQSKNPDKPIKEDFIYAFHNLFIKDGELVALGTLDYSNDYKKKVGAILSKEKFTLSAFDKNWKTSKMVRSEHIALQKGKVTLYLTRNDPKCDMR